MSHNIIHILQHNSFICKERGFLVCRSLDRQKQRKELKHPIEDIRAIVIAAKGVTFTSNLISAVLSEGAIILHCDDKFLPSGITCPLEKSLNTAAYSNQAKQPVRFNKSLWKRMLIAKTVNQKLGLESMGASSAYLGRAIESKHIDEGNCARYYWREYFPLIGYPQARRNRQDSDVPNAMLNYGYTVLTSLCHRSLVAHGLSPLLGTGHVARYGSNPLAYDVMEPYRPFIDCYLFQFLSGNLIPAMRDWTELVSTQLTENLVKSEDHSIRLVSAIDKTVQGLVRCYSEMKVTPLWFPEIEID